MPRQRLGVALLIPEPYARELDALRRAVGVDDTTLIPPHLTLVPPVNVREVDIGGALDVLRDAAAGSGPIRLELGPVTTFAPVSPTLHLRVGGDVDAVHALRNAVFRDPLERHLTHEFVPHVTLTEDSDRIDEAVRAMAGYRCEVVIEHVHLLEEFRRDDDHERAWRSIADARLGKRPGVVGRGGLELELTTAGILPPDAHRWAAERWDDLDVERFGRVLPKEVPLSVVARRDDRIVGVATGEYRPTTTVAYLAELIVASDVRNEGVGAHVVAAFTAAAIEEGASVLTLRTLAEGRARSFYERLGFHVVDTLPAWRNGRDFVQMRKDL